MIVGEAPGRKEIEQGIPFCGRSGTLLNDALSKAGISRDKIYITNCFKGDVGEGNPTPTRKQLLEHKEILDYEINNLVKPKSILTLGRISTNELIDEKYREEKMKRLVGNSFYNYFYGANIFPCWHPAYVLRNRNLNVVSEFYESINNFANSIVNSSS